MTLSEIYNRAMFLVYGDSTPPAALTTQAQAVTEGLIANFMRKVMDDYNYWWMEEEYGVAVPAYTRSLALPSDFKVEIGPVRILRFDSAKYETGSAECAATTAVVGTGTAWEADWSGKKYQISWDDATWYEILTVTNATNLTLATAGPTQAAAAYSIRKCNGIINLTKLPMGTEDKEGFDIGGTQSHPLYYDIYENTMRLFPMTDEATYLEMKYYKYLARPTTFLTHTDALTEEAPDAIAYYLASFEEKRRHEWQAAQVWEEMSDSEIQLMKNKHFTRSNGNVVLPYIDC